MDTGITRSGPSGPFPAYPSLTLRINVKKPTELYPSTHCAMMHDRNNAMEDDDMPTIKIADMMAWVTADDTRFSDVYGVGDSVAEYVENMMDDCNDPTAWTEDWLGYAQSCTPLLEKFMIDNGVVIDAEAGTVTYDIDGVKRVRAEAKAIYDEYDDVEARALGNDVAEPKVSLWEKYELGGDDDVDYNGGYIMTAMDALIAYHDAHN